MREMERWVLLRTIDSKWRDHLYEMDYLREGIGLRALAQRDPLVEYKNEGFKMFQEMMESIQTDFVRYLYHLEIGQGRAGGGGRRSARAAGLLGRRRRQPGSELRRLRRPPRARTDVADSSARPTRPPSRPPVPWWLRAACRKVGRNEPCPCGSGKKYKKCCGVAVSPSRRRLPLASLTLLGTAHPPPVGEQARQYPTATRWLPRAYDEVSISDGGRHRR